jgi:hypothetical protein
MTIPQIPLGYAQGRLFDFALRSRMTLAGTVGLWRRGHREKRDSSTPLRFARNDIVRGSRWCELLSYEMCAILAISVAE